MVVAIGVHIGHETAINFQDVDRKFLQIGKIRIAGAEIVHSQISVHCFQRIKDSPRPFGVVDKGAFGQLQCQPVARNLRTANRVFNGKDDIVALQLDCRQVDRNTQRQFAARALVPLRDSLRGAIQCPSAKRNNQSAFLRDRNELHRRNPATFGVLPPRQCLKPAQLPGVEIDQRLIMQVECPRRYRAAQIGFKSQSDWLRFAVCPRKTAPAAASALRVSSRSVRGAVYPLDHLCQRCPRQRRWHIRSEFPGSTACTALQKPVTRGGRSIRSRASHSTCANSANSLPLSRASCSLAADARV